MAREMPLEDRAGVGNLRLRRDQTVYAGAEIVEDEILLGRGLAVIDLLGPLLERQLDPESLVDGEGYIEKIQAVDPKIVDGVAFRLDLVAGDIARLGDDIGDRIEG